MDPSSVSESFRSAQNWIRSSADNQPKQLSPAPVQRVNQLDALELDSECRSHIWSGLSSLLSPAFTDRFEPELKHGLSVFIFTMTLMKQKPTPGQILQNLQPAVRSSQSLTIYAMIDIVIPYLLERFRFEPNRYALGAAQLVRIGNLLAFLYGAAYRTFSERLAGITYRYRQARVSRQIAFDFMNQELIWAGASDFLLFIVPLLNTQRLHSFVRSVLKSQFHRQPDLEGVQCGICLRSDAVCTPSMASCGHLFCYYCLKGSRLADPKFRCPICDQVIVSQTDNVPANQQVAG